MAAPTDNKGLNLAPDAGSLATDTYFAVQQSSASGIIQKMAQSSMSNTTGVTGVGFDNDKTFMTPKGLGLTIATDSSSGIARLATSTNIEGKAGDNVLTAGNMDKIFQEGIQQTEDIEQTDIDVADTEGTVTIVNVLGSTYGQRGSYEGRFTYVSDSNLEYKSIFIDNVRQPFQFVTGSGHYSRSDKSSSLKFPFTCSFEASGAPTDGIGRVRMDINTGIEGANWATGITYTLDFTIDYLAVI